jgi:hypothetical protein
MRDVPEKSGELAHWWYSTHTYDEAFADFKRWIAKAEARATAAERDRCLGLAMVTYDDIAELFIYETVGKTQDGSVALNKIIRARIVPPPPPPTDLRIAVAVDALFRASTYPSSPSDTVAIVLAAIDAMEDKS